MIHYMSTFGVGDAWVANELHVVESQGVPFVLHAMRAPTRALFASAWAAELARETRVIYPLPKLALVSSVAAAPFRFGGRFFAALGNALFGKRESLRARTAALWHFAVACHWAHSLRADDKPVTHIHSQWIHSGGTIAMYGAWLLGKSFSFTGHAADLFRDRVALEDKVRRAEFIVCISEFHRDFFKSLGARDEQLVIVYCGIDVDHFSPRPRSTRRPTDRLRIRSAGRLVAKKGFADLIDACKLLADAGVDFDCVIAGSGPLQSDLQSRIDGLALTDRVRLTGVEIKQEEIPDFMHDGDLFCLPCVRAPDGDIDGLPQMLMEAMGCGLPSLSTRLVGIPDLVIDGQTGLLVEPNQPRQIAGALIKLRDDPYLCERIVDRARRHLHERFEIVTALQPLIRKYREKLGATTRVTGGAANARTATAAAYATTAAAPAHEANDS
jgi:colanic acid/amylovoran biosynthesis glycosyltransferase